MVIDLRFRHRPALASCGEIIHDIYKAVRPAAAVAVAAGTDAAPTRFTLPEPHLEQEGVFMTNDPSSHMAGSGLRAGFPRGDGATAQCGAHGKVILMGEHAVVHGAPSIALPLLELQCRAWAVPSPGDGYGLVNFYVSRPSAARPGPGSVGLADAVRVTPPGGCRTLVNAALGAHRGRVRGVDVYLESGIPQGRGLGSSAAEARAVTGALDQLLQLHLSSAGVYELVQLAEMTAHGRASGVDTYATGSRAPLVLRDRRPHGLVIAVPAWVIVADSGTSSRTRQAVEMLDDTFLPAPERRRDFLERSEHLTEAALDALARAALPQLGERMTEAHALLASLGLVTDTVNSLVSAALSAGALGAKMTGGGLGGCAIALTDTAGRADALAAHLVSHGAVRTWIAPLLPTSTS